jgi:hypothetical protein
MTAAKSLERKEVERVTVALRNALKAECPEYPEAFLDSPPDSQPPASKRGAALWEAHCLAWSALVRFTRKQQFNKAKKGGQGAAFFDDSQNDVAIASLERARTLVRNAAAAVQRNIDGIRKARARLGLRGEDLENLPQQLAAIEKIGGRLDGQLRELKAFRTIPQARTRSDWDEFLSRTAKNLLDVGFGTREVAGMLTGKKAGAVDRATLERFRQRVNRLAESSS